MHRILSVLNMVVAAVFVYVALTEDPSRNPAAGRIAEVALIALMVGNAVLLWGSRGKTA